MLNVTATQIVERLKSLTPAQLAAVYDFAGYLAERSEDWQPTNYPDSERAISCIEDLQLDFWPEENSVDEFVTAREAWRAQDLALESELQI